MVQPQLQMCSARKVAGRSRSSFFVGEGRCAHDGVARGAADGRGRGDRGWFCYVNNCYLISNNGG